MNIKKTKTRFLSSSGYSIIELMTVVGMVAILAGISLVYFNPIKKAYEPEDTSLQVMRFMRQATNLSSAQRRRMRVEIDSTNRTISLYNEEGTISPTDDVLVRQEIMNGSTEVSLSQPSGVNVPAAPYNYTAAAFDATTGVWKGYFQGDGSVTDSSNIPLSATFFFSQPGSTNATRSNVLIRAVTVFGPSGALRLWKYRSGSLQTGVN